LNKYITISRFGFEWGKTIRERKKVNQTNNIESRSKIVFAAFEKNKTANIPCMLHFLEQENIPLFCKRQPILLIIDLLLT
jgi:hypothetical protein